MERVSEVISHDLRYRRFIPEGVTFALPDLTKKSRTGQDLKTSFHACFEENPNLCVVNIPSLGSIKTQQTFIILHSPHKPISSASLSRWLKDIISRAGIDTSIFKARSVRGASASAAYERGAPLQDILDLADWSTDSTLRRFYYRPKHNSGIAKAASGPSIICDCPGQRFREMVNNLTSTDTRRGRERDMSDSSSLCEDSDSSREDTSEEFSGFDKEFGLRPYQFEPELDINVSSSRDESSEGSEKSDENVDDQEDKRLANSNWMSAQRPRTLAFFTLVKDETSLLPSCVMVVVNGSQLCSSYHTLVGEVLSLGTILKDHGVVNFKTTCVTEISQTRGTNHTIFEERYSSMFCGDTTGETGNTGFQCPLYLKLFHEVRFEAFSIEVFATDVAILQRRQIFSSQTRNPTFS
ncbi:hypothetical protein P5673_012496 [Acropora cervicornis]|uniref:Tyr recombinase domain-containing protein n=1 Tax=Acropora cervicornis TaxID=6130 RepID=A0AAD9QN80_ACRCE|nr:hypothetical protein P5673_012496 [Acropora cervicornis]